MRYRFLSVAPACLFAMVAAAQHTTVRKLSPGDSWSAPSPATSSHYSSSVSVELKPSVTPFRFKSGSPGVGNQPPPSANDQAAAMGKERPWEDGKPPVFCASTPIDPSCH